ncbi:MAG: putative reductase [Syntrophorhabdaceae bacterium PtaU1.Bin034]|nr:MAG: putative reductase [Syntrophorhabdaceae bacterium PtaU1.Bin034]
MKKVTVYSISTCSWCKKAKKYFEEQCIPYENTDYNTADGQKQESIYRDMHDIGAGGFPVVKIGRGVVVGYKPDEYEELLGQGRKQ